MRSLILLLLALPLLATAQNKPTIQDDVPGRLAWLNGAWRGMTTPPNGQDDPELVYTEVWAVHHSGLMGMFAMHRYLPQLDEGMVDDPENDFYAPTGKLMLHEFWTLEPYEGRWVMFLRHFGAGNKPWEEKDAPLRFQLVELGTNSAHFRAPRPNNPDALINLTYTYDPREEILTVTLIEPENPTPNVFIYYRSE